MSTQKKTEYVENIKSKNKIQDQADDFVFCGADTANMEQIATLPSSYWKVTWKRFCANKVAVIAAIVMLLIIFLCIFGPVFSGYQFEQMDMKAKNQMPSLSHFFGTDQLGRDLFTRVCRGGRISITIGVAGAFISVIVGCLYGGISAYMGGAVDTVMMRIVEIISSVPHLLVVIMISIVLDSKSIGTLMFAMLVTSWCDLSRLVRSQMLQISQSEYVMAARQLGVHSIKIVLTHLIPNCMSIIIVNLTFRIPGLIFSEAFLSYVGLGVQSPETSWGALASAATASFLTHPNQLFFPTLMISLTMLCFILIGDGLRDAMDPKLWR